MKFYEFLEKSVVTSEVTMEEIHPDILQAIEDYDNQNYPKEEWLEQIEARIRKMKVSVPKLAEGMAVPPHAIRSMLKGIKNWFPLHQHVNKLYNAFVEDMLADLDAKRAELLNQ